VRLAGFLTATIHNLLTPFLEGGLVTDLASALYCMVISYDSKIIMHFLVATLLYLTELQQDKYLAAGPN
jgi:hypothetical protein